ncbi:hypothetical protein F5148DRAFT_888890 [Russula earlei]|uniref:Uncharacterized protein n=1 Tax=Russula earlei TaxID=71964 RepID=A0ACC0UBS5_9AGAM|nr:hypothetical protein F5148DRAFT_888890 [Russula earlei]
MHVITTLSSTLPWSIGVLVHAPLSSPMRCPIAGEHGHRGSRKTSQRPHVDDISNSYEAAAYVIEFCERCINLTTICRCVHEFHSSHRYQS